jgi:hypothetical protein
VYSEIIINDNEIKVTSINQLSKYVIFSVQNKLILELLLVQVEILLTLEEEKN